MISSLKADKLSSSKIICIFGPTGTGKSSIASFLSKTMGGEIINCDSRQVYRDFPCITDQPDEKNKSQNPHWLYGFLSSNESIDAGKYVELADPVIKEVSARNRVPVLVGGTGLYFLALLYGLSPIPKISQSMRKRVQDELAEKGPGVLHEQLRAVDPKAAGKIHPRDGQRITRALEVYLDTGIVLSQWHSWEIRQESRYQALKIGINMDWPALSSRLQERIEYMLSTCAYEEALQAWRRCPEENAYAWSSIGAYEMLQYILGRWSLEQTKQKWWKNTRNYAKRQLTWFRKEKGTYWFSPQESRKILDLAQNWLQKEKL